MSNKAKIVKEFKDSISLLKKHNKLYYEKDSPEISDAEYDTLKKKIYNLEKKFPYLKKIETANNLIGSPPSNKFKKIKHLVPMLSLSNAFNEKDMEDFLKKVKNFLNLHQKQIELISEPKIDGISATLVYENGILIKGLSRGDGYTGKDRVN